MKVSEIIDKFGGVRPMQVALGHENPTTVQYWAKKKKIPHWRHSEILAAAKKLRIKITAADIAKANGAT